jgi:hypothetical protein
MRQQTLKENRSLRTTPTMRFSTACCCCCCWFTVVIHLALLVATTSSFAPLIRPATGGTRPTVAELNAFSSPPKGGSSSSSFTNYGVSQRRKHCAIEPSRRLPLSCGTFSKPPSTRDLARVRPARCKRCEPWPRRRESFCPSYWYYHHRVVVIVVVGALRQLPQTSYQSYYERSLNAWGRPM